MKKKIIIAVAILVVIGGILALVLTNYMIDSKDTEELFRENVSSVEYENTIETALPQTELYSIIEEHFKSDLPKGKTEKKAIIIGYDGCRADVLTEMQAENSAISALLNDGASLNLLYCGGVEYPEMNTQDTSTAPGWCSILTGVWADEHGITGNSITKKVEPKTLLTSLVEDGVIDNSAFITKWAGHFTKEDSTYILEKQYCEEQKLDVSFNKCKNDKDSLALAVEEINKKDCADFIFVIYEPTDSTGHNLGFTHNSPYYKNSFVKADSYGFETLEAIKQRENYENEDWLIIITSDHGGKGTDHGDESIQERMTFAVVK